MKYKIFLLTLSLALLFLTGLFSVSAQDSVDNVDTSKEVNELQEKIEEYEEELEEIRSEKASLQKEISYATAQISLTEARIANAVAELAKKTREIQELSEDIEDLKLRIDKLLKSIDFQRDVLGQRKRAYYKIAESTPPDVEFFFFLVSPANLVEKIQKATYSEVMQERDKKLLLEMERTQSAYTKQKDLFEDTKKKEEDLKQQVVAQKASLDNYKAELVNQKVAKAELLKETQNDEMTYQKLLADAKREFEQIVGAAGALVNTNSRAVKKGELLGLQGSTGRSTGPHLHFGIYRYSSIEEINNSSWYYSDTVDPAKKLKSKSVIWESCTPEQTVSVGRGDWEWPMKGTIRITNSFGINCYKDWYNLGREHPAFDMVVNGSSIPVYAVEDGDAYFCRNCLGDGGNGVFIFHDNDYMTLYWHLQ